MDNNLYRSTALSMIELVICAIKGETPKPEVVEGLQMDALFTVCQKHILTACTAYALEAAGIRNEDFTQAKAKAIRKNILLDAERKKVLQRLEQEGIWYMPLKGALLKDWYPKLGMRQMSDNDILCDGAYRPRIREIMLELGFTCEHFGQSADDAYYKPPVSNFEMHSQLFALTHMGKLYEYYENVKERLVKDEGSEYGYQFRMEDFYIYVTAHEYKHYKMGGTGIRFLADTYVFLKRWNDTLDWDYIRQELRKLEIADYEQESRTLTMKLFAREELTDDQRQMLDYYIFSGVYGNLENRVKNDVERFGGGSKAKYVFRRVFPSMNEIQSKWGFFYRHKWLIPALWIYRPFHSLLRNPNKIKNEVKYLNKKS